MPNTPLITVGEACTMLGLSAQMVRGYLAKGLIKGEKKTAPFANYPVWQIDRASVEQFKPRPAGRPKQSEAVPCPPK